MTRGRGPERFHYVRYSMSTLRSVWTSQYSSFVSVILVSPLVKWCCGGLSSLTLLRHTYYQRQDDVRSGKASGRVRGTPCTVYASWLSLDPLCLAAGQTCLEACGEVGE